MVMVRMWGPLTAGEIRTAVAEIVEGVPQSEGYLELIDLRGLTSVDGIASPDVRAIASSPLDAASKRAFVVPDPTAFGLARMFATFRSLRQTGDEVGVFRTIEDAENWLGLSPV